MNFLHRLKITDQNDHGETFDILRNRYAMYHKSFNYQVNNRNK